MPSLSVKQAKTQREIADAFKVRQEVFIKEQKIPEEIELDGKDHEAEHIIAYLNGEPIGCVRIRDVDSRVKIERMAVLSEHRGQGFGRFILNYTIKLIRRKYPKQIIYLHSQKDVEEFYKKAGFVTKGRIFYEAGIPHVKMVLEKRQ